MKSQEEANQTSKTWVEKPHAGWLLYWVRASTGMAPALAQAYVWHTIMYI